MAPAWETARLCLEMANKTKLPELRIESQYAQGFLLYMREDLLVIGHCGRLPLGLPPPAR